MEWLTLHGTSLAGGILLLVGLVAMVYPKALVPHKRMEALKKIHLPQDFSQQKEQKNLGEFPLALSLFLRLTGSLFAIAGIVILLAQH
jgi:hypothetical protein